MQKGCADFLFWSERSLFEKQDVSEDKKDVAKADVADFIKVVLNHYKSEFKAILWVNSF